MKVNQHFIKDNPEAWETILANHRRFNGERWRWREIVRRTRVSGTAKDVALSLIDKFGGGEDCRVFPSHAALAADTLLDERTVRAAVAKLHDAGLIFSRSRGSTSTTYFFADPTDTNVTVVVDQWKTYDRHKRDSLTDTFVTDRESHSCLSDRHKRDAKHDQLTRPLIMTAEHDTVSSCEGAPAVHDLPLVDHSFGPGGPQVAEVPREDQIDDLLADAIRDADDSELLPLRHHEIREAFARRYGNAMEHKWWVVAEWFSSNLDWIDCISELERMDDGEEEIRQAHG